MPIGALIEVLTILLIATSYSIVCTFPPIAFVISLLGDTSTVMYIVHILIHRLAGKYLVKYSLFSGVISNKYLYPIFILVVSALIGILFALGKVVLQNKFLYKKNKFRRK